MTNEISVELIATRILIVRGKRVMLDRDLALLYEVPTKRLNEQVRRNRDRFPEDFMFQLTKGELDSLRSHFATLNKTESKVERRRKKADTLWPSGQYLFDRKGELSYNNVLKLKLLPS